MAARAIDVVEAASAVDRDGNVTMPYNTKGMVRGVTSDDLSPRVNVY